MDKAQRLGRLMYAAAGAIGLLPLGILRAVGAAGGRLMHVLNVREAKVARRNLEIIAPELDAAERERRVGALLRATGRNLLETLRVWTRPRAANLRLVRAVHGAE